MLTACRFRTSLTVSLLLLANLSIVHAEYSGGSGTAEDPYQIATAADLIALDETPDDYDKHFILTADTDLSDLDVSEGRPGFVVIRITAKHLKSVPTLPRMVAVESWNGGEYV
jgi:hypothetical protein